MKITKRQLGRIIRETLEKVNWDNPDSSWGPNDQDNREFEQDEWDIEEQARYDALNDTKDRVLYRDNPEYRDAFDNMQFDKDQRSSMGGDW